MPNLTSLALAAALAVLSTPAKKPVAPAAAPLAIVDVTVIPMEGAARLEHQTVVVADGMIRSVGATGRDAPPTGARIVDGRGKFLIPGLTDSHVHLSDAGDLPLFLARGVTTVHDLNGSTEVLVWRAAVRAGTMAGPRILASGPMIGGAEIPWRNKVVPASPDEARAIVRTQKAAGYDFIKVYDGLTAEAYAAVIAAARDAGLIVRGHIPASVGLSGVLAARQGVIEHTEKIVFAAWGHRFDTTHVAAIADSVRRAGSWVTPTLAVQQQLGLIGTGRFDSLMARPEVALAPTATADFWRTVSARTAGTGRPLAGVRYNPWVDMQMTLTLAFARAGVPLLAGTDLPNGVMVPGYSLADELAALVEAGLTSMEALRAATVNPATLIGEGTTSGSVAAHKRADLVLLAGDPTIDIGSVRRIEGVVAGGTWYDPAALNKLLAGRH